MAFPRAYLSSARNLPAIFAAIQTSKAPPRFDKQFLESLEFKSPSDRKIIGVLKALKFISDEGAPTERYYAYLDQAKAPGILADAIREAYADLFRMNVNAQNLTKGELIFKFWTLSQGELSGSAMDKMIMTFTELCKLADFQTPPPMKEKTKRDDEGTPDGKIKEPQAEDLWKEVRVGGLVYRAQSISPETPDRWRTAIRPLVLFPIAIFAAAALVGIFGAPLREWAKATPVFRPFLANEMPLAPPAVRIPANSK